MMLKLKLVTYVLLFSTLLTPAQVISVPSNQPTIQAAINNSNDGDTVLVNDGIYYENINFFGKKITIASLFLIDKNTDHIKNTIINGSKSKHPQHGSVVYYVSGEDTNSVLYGFTITGGTGTNSPPNHKYKAIGGGGIGISKSGAKIEYCNIIGNKVVGERASGGGMIIDSPKSSVIIKNNRIVNNSIKVTISHGGGAGIFCLRDTSSQVIIMHNIFSNNLALDTNSSTAMGGAVKLIESSPIIKNNLIKHNLASLGGGIATSYPINCKEVVIENNTIVDNHAKLMGGAIFSFSQHYLISNCIIWNNTAPRDSQIIADISVEYSNIQGGKKGLNNIDQDPMFANSIFFNLTDRSPCIDTGNPDSTYDDPQESKKTGFARFPSHGKVRNDIGAYGGTYSKSFWEFRNDR